MSLIVNGATLPSNAVITCNGVTLSSIVCNAVEVWKKGTLTLKEVVFNASGTFTMPSGVVDNQIIVGCTGGGGGGYQEEDGKNSGGGGSGRTVTSLTMSAGATATVTVGAGGAYARPDTAYDGGTSSFTGATPCLGGKKGTYGGGGAGVSGGGAGGYRTGGSSSSCPASLTLQSGAINSTTSLFTAKSYSGGSLNGASGGGGGGCYGAGGLGSVGAGEANTGAGGGSGKNGGSGKVVVWYYTYE